MSARHFTGREHLNSGIIFVMMLSLFFSSVTKRLSTLFSPPPFYCSLQYVHAAAWDLGSLAHDGIYEKTRMYENRFSPKCSFLHFLLCTCVLQVGNISAGKTGSLSLSPSPNSASQFDFAPRRRPNSARFPSLRNFYSPQAAAAAAAAGPFLLHRPTSGKRKTGPGGTATLFPRCLLLSLDARHPRPDRSV